jgi:hypothetical protein
MVVRKLQNGQGVEERSWRNHRHRPGIYPVGLRKIMRNFSQGCHPQYEICNLKLHTRDATKPAALLGDIEYD